MISKEELDTIEATLAGGNLNEIVDMAEERIPTLVAEVRRLRAALVSIKLYRYNWHEFNEKSPRELAEEALK